MKEVDPADIGVHLNTEYFISEINNCIEKFNVKTILECGTNNGSGSSTVFAQTGLNFHTCELNKAHYEEAIKNLGGFKNAKCNHAFSTKKEDCEIIFKTTLESRGHLPTKENWLEKTFKREYKKLGDGESILVFLDAHWTCGFIEFRKIFDFWYTNKPLENKIILALDDVTNLKHRPAMRYIEQFQIPIDIISKRERWAILKLE